VNDVFYKHVALLELAAERKKLSHAGPKDVNREAELSG
jgi:hypothetical protein